MNARAQIYEVLNAPDIYEVTMQDGGAGLQLLTDRLLELFNKLDDQNRCDFDCDNCHMGGCGNSLCERMGCPEDNAELEAQGLL